MGKKYTGKDGLSIQFINNKINAALRKNSKKSKVNITKTYTSGTLKSDDMQKILVGMSLLSELINAGMNSQKNKLLLGEQDVSKIRANIWNYGDIISNTTRDLENLLHTEHMWRQQIEALESIADITQAARDGIILKKETRYETVNGKQKKVSYDTSMTDMEIMRKIDDYARLSDAVENRKIRNYMNLGLSIAGVLGTIAELTIKTDHTSDKKIDKKGTLSGILSIATAAIPLIDYTKNRRSREEARNLRSKSRSLECNALLNEQISVSSKKDAVKASNKADREVLDFEERDRFKETSINNITYLVVALITGMYLKSKLKINENGKIDGKSFAQAILELQATKGTVNSVIRAISQLNDMKKSSAEYEEVCKELNEIISQMEEKVYPLEGAKKPFEKLEIENLEGKFYPKKNYETGKTVFSTVLNVPEFSMERGQTVLLSGESGTGKSTFLRLLKRGDINNPKCIKLDGKEVVDSLGDQYISFRPDIELGNDTNILFQITGKESVSNLKKEEKENLIRIMRELELDSRLDSKKLLEQMASKKFMEYSTGQQKRLALSKLFYRITDGTSAIIVDEPVGNVEDRLIRQQLEMIKKYAKKQNVMLLLVTHRIDAVKDLVDKRYHIDNNGIMKEIPVEKEIEQDQK